MSIEFRKSTIVEIDFNTPEGVETRNVNITMLPATKAYKYFKKLTTSEEGGVGGFSEEEIKDLVITSTQIKPEKFDIVYAGNMMALMALVGKIVDYNFEDVFTALGSEGQTAVE